MAVILPNYEDASPFDAMAVRDAVDYYAMDCAAAGTGVIFGCAVSASVVGTTTAVIVSSGTVVSAGSVYPVASASVAVGTASTSDRRDTVVYTPGTGLQVVAGGPCGYTTGAWTLAAGTSGNNPPVKQYSTGTYAVTTGAVPLAEAYVATTTTTANWTTSNNIVDKRPSLLGYIGSWTGPGAPPSGTYSVGQFGLDKATPALWVCTTAGTIGSGAVFQNLNSITSSFSALSLSLTENVAYTPTSAVKGNTAFLASQNETLTFLPPVSGLAANGSTWTVTFSAPIIGSGTPNTLGAIGDTFPCWLQGFSTGAGTGAYAGTTGTAASTMATVPLTAAASAAGFGTGGGNATIVTSGGSLTFSYTGISSSSVTGCTLPSSGVNYTVTNGAAVTPSWNNGNSLVPLTATVSSSVAATIPRTDSPPALTASGICQTNPIQYTTYTSGVGAASLAYPRAISEIEGTNTFKSSVSALYGIGPVYQNVMNYINATPYSVSASCTNGGYTYRISGDVRANIAPNAKILGASIPSNSAVTSLWYDGTYTNVQAFVINSFTPASWTGTSGNNTITFTADITTGESFVSAPCAISNAASVQFPTNPTGFMKPGAGQGWGLGYWSGPVFGNINGGTLSGIQVADFLSEMYLADAGTYAVQRWGMFVDDVWDLLTQGTGGSLTTQIAALYGHLNNDLTVDTLYGASVNVGLLNYSTEYGPGQTPVQTLAASVNLAASVFSGTGTPATGGTGTLVLNSTSWLPSTGSLKIPYSNGLYNYVNYTGLSGASVTGCTWQSGSAGTVTAGTAVLGTAAYNSAAAIPITVGSSFTLPTPLSTKMRLTSSASVISSTSQVITSTPYADGQKVTLINVGSYNITFNTGGTTGLLFSAPSAYILAPKQSVTLQWDSGLSIWVQDNQSSLLQQMRVVTVNAPSLNPSWNSDVTDTLYFTGMSASISSMTQNWSGNPYAGQKLTIIFLDNGTPRAITWGTRFQSSGTVTLPTATNGSTTTVLSCDFIWNAAATSPNGQWRIVRTTT